MKTFLSDLQHCPSYGQYYEMVHILDRFTDLQNGPYSGQVYKMVHILDRFIDLQNEVISNKRQPQHPESPFLHNPAKELDIFMSKPMLGPLFKPIWINSQNLVLACLNSK